MICYNLICRAGHEFEGWFGSSADYDDQAERGLLACPECGTAKVEKAIMAPAVRRTDQARSIKSGSVEGQTPNAQMMVQITKALREEIAANCDDVGEDFAQEARAIHEGEAPARGIYGKATKEQAQQLVEDGVPALPLPEALNPKRAKRKLN